LDPLDEILAQGLSWLGIASDPASLERWSRLARLLERWGERINLTGHRGADQIARRLLLEAAAFSAALPPAATIADLGSGAGIPGIPIALCRPDTQVLLVDSRERRHHFQRAAIRELGLTGVRALRGRVEELTPQPCAGVVSQAFARPGQALEWMLPWVAEGGWIALATVADAAAPAAGLTELDFVASVPYAAPGGPPRSAWLARRPPEGGSATR